jgi:hypothetical protein
VKDHIQGTRLPDRDSKPVPVEHEVRFVTCSDTHSYRVLVGKPEGKRPLERPKRRWEDGIKMDLRKIGWGGGVDWPGSG